MCTRAAVHRTLNEAAPSRVRCGRCRHRFADDQRQFLADEDEIDGVWRRPRCKSSDVAWPSASRRPTVGRHRRRMSGARRISPVAAFRCGLPRLPAKSSFPEGEWGGRRRRTHFHVQSTPGLCWTRLDDRSVEGVVAIHVDQEPRHVLHGIRAGVVLASRRLRPVVVVTSCVAASGGGSLEDVPVLRRCRLHLPDLRRGASGTAGQAVRHRREPGTLVRPAPATGMGQACRGRGGRRHRPWAGHPEAGYPSIGPRMCSSPLQMMAARASSETAKNDRAGTLPSW